MSQTISTDSIRKPLIDQKPILFTPSKSHSIGIEIELWIVDPRTGRLVPRSADLIAAVGGDASDWMKHELFQCIVEVVSKKCENVEEARQDLSAKLLRVFAGCDKIGVAVMGAGTHPFENYNDQPILDNERYQGFIERMGWPARRLLITGLHVHVGLDSGEKAVAILNSLVAFIPHLLAFSANSPYFQGMDTKLASARLKIFELLPTAGLPPRVTNWQELVRLMRTLIQASAITSIREIWWDVRPHHGLGTVEIRIMDNPSSPTETLAIAAFVQSLVAHLSWLYDQGQSLPELMAWTVRENKWRACRWADKMELIRNERGDTAPIAEHMRGVLADIFPFAESLGCAQYFPVLEEIMAKGAGYQRQRDFIAAGHSMPELVQHLAKCYREDLPYGAMPKVPKFYA